MPGGDAAAREPFRMALAWLHAVYGEGVFNLPLPFLAGISAQERKVYLRMLERRINSPLTSSCGRLFDAVAAIIGLRNLVTYEGQAAIELEALAERDAGRGLYPFSIARGEGPLVLDWRRMVEKIAEDAVAGTDRAVIACAFHNTLAAAVAEVCEESRAESGTDRVVLSGGVFQNGLLSEGVHTSLSERGFRVYSQRLAPPNDGGLALGQAVIAGRALKRL
jgi:hydrogenase maturation protein HypF